MHAFFVVNFSNFEFYGMKFIYVSYSYRNQNQTIPEHQSNVAHEIRIYINKNQKYFYEFEQIWRSHIVINEIANADWTLNWILTVPMRAYLEFFFLCSSKIISFILRNLI